MAKSHLIKILSSLFFFLKSFILAGQVPDTLPVVVHIIHTGEAIGTTFNPSDASIQAMFTLVNHAYAKNRPFYRGAVMPFFLKLASTSPSCTFTTGINQVNGSGVPQYATGGITFDTAIYPNSAHELFV